MMSSRQARKPNQSPQLERTRRARVSGPTKSARHRCAFAVKALCVSLGLLVTLIACHRNKQKVIAIVPKGQGHIFWQTVHAGAKAAGQKFGVTVLWNGPASEIEISKQINILEDFINRRVDGIVVAPSDQKA